MVVAVTDTIIQVAVPYLGVPPDERSSSLGRISSPVYILQTALAFVCTHVVVIYTRSDDPGQHVGNTEGKAQESDNQSLQRASGH